MNNLILKEKEIQNKIFTIRNQQVMLDRDLAQLYQVETRALKQAVKRKIDRFPDDFMFELTDAEIDFLVSQSVIPSKKYFGGAKPFAFTEQGVSMLSSVLTSKTAVQVNIAIFRAFTKMRKFIATNAVIFQKFNYIEQKLIKHDENFEKVFKA
ncbi:MAG: ORF6N domain-containing protein, partial [Melioribacteraceae bacterium]|nr:ORF6N domain-containing protein [Melioribacteraceae bacterium]